MKITEAEDRYLRKLYFNVNSAGAFRSANVLYQRVKKENKYPIGLSRIRQWLQNNDVYSMHRAARRRYKRRHVITAGIDDEFDTDLMDVQKWSAFNDGTRFLLIVIDIFSKYLWVVPLKNKTGITVKNGFETVFKQKRIPRKIRSDSGTEYTGKIVQAFFKKMGVKHFTTNNEGKSNVAERVIRTLRGLLSKYMSHKNTHRYVDVLQSIVESYNTTPHRTLHNISPSEVNKQNEVDLILKMYFSPPKKSKPRITTMKSTTKMRNRSPFKLKVNDTVRVSLLKRTFQKEYEESWSGEIFKVTKRYLRQNIPLYELEDLSGEGIKGTFYQSELLKVEKPLESTLWKVQTVLKTRRRKGVREGLVKWLHFPSKFNSWLPLDELVDIQAGNE